MWFRAPTGHGHALPREIPPARLFCAGLIVTFTNPKIIVFYLALLSTITDLGQVSFGDWTALTGTLVATLAVIDILYILLAEAARRWTRLVTMSGSSIAAVRYLWGVPQD